MGHQIVNNSSAFSSLPPLRAVLAEGKALMKCNKNAPYFGQFKNQLEETVAFAIYRNGSPGWQADAATRQSPYV